MYTVEDERNDDLYEDEHYYNKWDNYKGIIFKVIIIILCIIVLVWLFKALNSNRDLSNVNDVHNANVTKLRLAAEDYFFVKNSNKLGTVNLFELKNEGLISDLKDANNRLCNNNATTVNLEKDIDTYVMKINLSCSNKEKEEKFYYHRNTLACLNCKGITNMTGKVVAHADENKTSKPISSINNDYSCVSWSNWSKTKVNDSSLTERKRVMVQGVKYGKKTLKGNWSEYSTTPVLSSDLIEVETKVEREKTWGEVKTGTDIDANNPNIRIISTSIVNEASNDCSNGYYYDGACYSNKTKVGNLTFNEYYSGNYRILNSKCESARTVLSKNNIYELTYFNCRYNEKLSSSNQTGSYILYVYQEYEEKDVTYYRYRIVSESKDKDVYTDKKYEEDKLPSGYVKVKGTEEVYYSYKITNCEK